MKNYIDRNLENKEIQQIQVPHTITPQTNCNPDLVHQPTWASCFQPSRHHKYVFSVLYALQHCYKERIAHMKMLKNCEKLCKISHDQEEVILECLFLCLFYVCLVYFICCVSQGHSLCIKHLVSFKRLGDKSFKLTSSEAVASAPIPHAGGQKGRGQPGVRSNSAQDQSGCFYVDENWREYKVQKI